MTTTVPKIDSCIIVIIIYIIAVVIIAVINANIQISVGSTSHLSRYVFFQADGTALRDEPVVGKVELPRFHGLEDPLCYLSGTWLQGNRS